MQLPNLKPFFSWVKSVYSEPDGSGSSTRVHIGLLTVFVIAVGISFGVLVHERILTAEQFDNFLTAGAGFLVTTTGPLYATNKLADWAKNRDNQNGQNSTQ
jgi:hypothetical protein